MEVRKLLLALLVVLSAAPLRADRVLMAPCKGNRITGTFLEPRSGHAHGGVDWGLPVGSPVYAVDSGTVVSAGWHGAFGLLVRIRHSDGAVSYYGHLSKLHVRADEAVLPGELIALSGNTGRSPGPHLHFEVRDAAGPIDPLKYLGGEILPAGAARAAAVRNRSEWQVWLDWLERLGRSLYGELLRRFDSPAAAGGGFHAVLPVAFALACLCAAIWALARIMGLFRRMEEGGGFWIAALVLALGFVFVVLAMGG